MPFNAAGVYTLPQAAFVTGTTISSTAVNSNFSDIASALTTAYQYSLTLAGQLQGAVQMTKSAASTIKLSPYNGNSLLIQGTTRQLTSAGATLTLAALTNNTLYYVYAYWTGSAIAIEASTTGHTTDTTYGNEIKTGDASRSLVGMFYTTAVDDTTDSETQRLVASWFNPPVRTIVGTAMSAATTTSVTAVELNSTTSRVEVVLFANRPGEVQFQGDVTNSTVSVNNTTNIGVDSSTAASGTDQVWNSGNPAVRGPFNIYIPVAGSLFPEGRHYITPLGFVASNTGSWTGRIRGWVT